MRSSSRYFREAAIHFHRRFISYARRDAKSFALFRTEGSYNSDRDEAYKKASKKTVSLPYNISPYMHFEPIFQWKDPAALDRELLQLRPYSIGLNNPQPWQLLDRDVIRPELNCVLLRVITSPLSELVVHTGERGINLREGQTFDDLLTYQTSIPQQTEGYIIVPAHVPCRITDPSNTSVVLKDLEYGTEFVPTYEQNKNRYHQTTIFTDPQRAKQKVKRIQDRIQRSDEKQMFGKEETLVVKPVSPLNARSETLMFFNGSTVSPQQSDTETTESHFHPGDRYLKIWTHDKSAGVILNFAGPFENINDRSDLRKVIEFPKNSFFILWFDAFVHHEFFGEFSCVSVHNQEGYNIAENDDPEAKNAFLEYATITSATNPTTLSQLKKPKTVNVQLRTRHGVPLYTQFYYRFDKNRLQKEVFEVVKEEGKKPYTRPMGYAPKTRAAKYNPLILRLDKENRYQYVRTQVHKIQVGDYDGVIFDCDSMLTINSEASILYHLRGVAKMKLNRYKLNRYREAIPDFTKALFYDPNFSDGYCYRGVCNYAIGNYTTAIEDLNKYTASLLRGYLSYVKALIPEVEICSEQIRLNTKLKNSSEVSCISKNVENFFSNYPLPSFFGHVVYLNEDDTKWAKKYLSQILRHRAPSVVFCSSTTLTLKQGIFNNVVRYAKARFINALRHPALNHELFDYLHGESVLGFSREAFAIYRSNYFVRTRGTIPSIARTIISAALAGDYKTLALAGHNLFEETGENNENNVHLKLLEDSHNEHAKRVFNLPPLKLVDAPSSEYVLPVFSNFIDEQEKLYSHHSDQIGKGVMLAHETLATNMLKTFYNSFFISYSDYYTEEEFEKLTRYFTIHLDGTEERHGQDALEAASSGCKDFSDVNEVIAGINAFCELQGQLWDALLSSIKKSQLSNVEKIQPKQVNDFLV